MYYLNSENSILIKTDQSAAAIAALDASRDEDGVVDVQEYVVVYDKDSDGRFVFDCAHESLDDALAVAEHDATKNALYRGLTHRVLRVSVGAPIIDLRTAPVVFEVGADGARSYTFVVGDPNDIDFERLARENPDSNALVLRVAGNAQDVVLLIRKEFCAKFELGDALTMCSKKLYSHWGTTSVCCSYNNRTLERASGFGISSNPFRARWIKAADIPQIRAELAAADAYERKLRVTVERL